MHAHQCVSQLDNRDRVDLRANRSLQIFQQDVHPSSTSTRSKEGLSIFGAWQLARLALGSMPTTDIACV